MTGTLCFEGRGAEVLVDRVEAGQHLVEGHPSDGDHERKADGRVVRVAAADPVPEHEHVVGVDPELGHGLGVGRHGDEVLGHGVVAGLVAQALEEPVPGGRRVGQRLERGERLGADDEQRGGRVEVVGGGVEVDRVDVGDEAAREAGHRLVGQGLGGHGRAEVGAADADVDDGPDALAGGAHPVAVADALGQLAHLVEDVVDVLGDVLAVDRELLGGGHAECHVEDGAVLGRVDVLAFEHGVAAGLDAGGPGDVHEEGHGVVGDAVLGVVQDEAGHLGGEALGSVGVVREELAQDEVLAGAVVVGLQRLPGGSGRQVHDAGL